MINLKRLCSIICFGLIVSATKLFAQDINIHLTGQVYDKELQEGVIQASVVLLSLPDSAMTAGVVSDMNGFFDLKAKIKPKRHVLKFSYLGYKTTFVSVDPSKAVDGSINLSRIDLVPNAILLSEAVITGEAPQVTLVGDTVVFNASSYRVTQNAMLEELVKKLPGAQVDNDGKITINGKEITKIMIDGKEFFAKDPNIAMKNIPVDMVERLKTYDKKSDQARITGIDDGEEETVLDLSVKKDMNKGWFGNVDAGIGNHDRYQAKGIINKFSDGDQITGIFNFNNVRDASVGGGRRWFRQNGMEENRSGGINLAFERKKFTISGSVNYSDVETDKQIKSTSETFLQENSSFTKGYSNSINRNKTFSSDFRLEWRPDSMTTLLFIPSINVGKSNSRSDGFSQTAEIDDFDNWDELMTKNLAINSEVTNSYSSGDNFSTGGRMIFNRKLNNRGRNIGFNMNYNIGNSSNESNSYSLIQYYKEITETGKIPDDERDLFTDNDINSNSFRFKVNYSEPIAKQRFLQFSYAYQTTYNKTDRKTYNMQDWKDGGATGDLDDFIDPDLSKLAKNYYDNHEISINLNTIKEKYNYNIGFTVQPQKNRMKYKQSSHDIDTVRSVVNFTPVFDFRYKFHKQSQLRITYRGRTSQPNMTDLLPIRDITNPLNVREGNPGLKPSYTNMFMLFYNNYIAKSQSSIVANVFFQNMINSVSSKVTYDTQTGARVTRPENINGNWNIRSFAGFNTPLKNKKFTISNFVNFSFNNIMGYLAVDKESEAQKNKTRNLVLGDNLSFNYRGTWFEAGVNSGFSYSKVKNTLQPQSNRNTYDWNFGFNSNIQLPWDMSFSTDLSYNIRNGYSQGMDKGEVIWNAQLAKSFLKKKQATISLQMFDILKQRSNLSRSISASMRTDTEYNEISNYFMVHFVYALNTFGGKGKEIDTRPIRNYGGPPSHGRRPR